MSKTVHSAETLDALTKEMYSDGIQEVVPSATKLVNMVPFQESKKLGQEYVHPILLTLENGFTYGGPDGDAFDLAPPSKSNIQKARIRGHEMVLRSATSIKNIISQQTDAGSFKRHLKFLTANMLKSMFHRLEIQLMYGDAGLAEVDSVSGAIISIKESEWAPAIWNGSEGSLVEVFSPAGALKGEGQIVQVSQDDRSITLKAPIAGLAQDDEIYWKGARGQEFKGLHAIATTSGNLFGIDNNQFDLFKANVFDVGASAANPAPLSFPAIQRGVAKAITKGYGEDEMVVVVNPKVWVSLLTEQAALRRYDSSYSDSQFKTGSESIVYHSQNGKLEIVSSNFCKEGYAYGFSKRDMMRVGSSDVSFKDPVTGEDKYFRHLENNNGVEMRGYCDQALFTPAPARIVIFRFIKAEEQE